MDPLNSCSVLAWRSVWAEGDTMPAGVKDKTQCRGLLAVLSIAPSCAVGASLFDTSTTARPRAICDAVD
jgi:hypothetical protein